MAQANGRVFLKTDGGARDLDRLVDREVRMTLYPHASQSDVAVSAEMLYLPGTNETLVSIVSVQPNGERKVLHTERVNNSSAPYVPTT